MSSSRRRGHVAGHDRPIIWRLYHLPALSLATPALVHAAARGSTGCCLVQMANAVWSTRIWQQSPAEDKAALARQARGRCGHFLYAAGCLQPKVKRLTDGKGVAAKWSMIRSAKTTFEKSLTFAWHPSGICVTLRAGERTSRASFDPASICQRQRLGCFLPGRRWGTTSCRSRSVDSKNALAGLCSVSICAGEAQHCVWNIQFRPAGCRESHMRAWRRAPDNGQSAVNSLSPYGETHIASHL